MEKPILTAEEQRFVDIMVGAFALVQEIEGTRSAAEFVVANVIRSDDMLAEAADHSFLYENGIDSASL